MGALSNSYVLTMNNQNCVANWGNTTFHTSNAVLKTITHTMHVCKLAGETLGCILTMGRQSETNWQRLEQRSGRQTGRHAGRSYGALIPMLGRITPEFIYSIAISFIYTLHMLVEFYLPTSLFSFLHNYSFSFIYLQNIILTDYIPTVM